MSQEFEMPDDFERGKEYPLPGQYHVAISSVEENPLTKSGKVRDGLAVDFVVLHGTVQKNGQCTEVKKSWQEFFATPNLSNKDGGKYLRKRQAFLALAAGLVSPDDRGKKVQINWQDLCGRQLVVTVREKEPWTDDRGNEHRGGVEIDGLHMYAVDDQAVAHVPKDEKALKLLPQKSSGGNGNGNGGANGGHANGGQSAQPATAGAASGSAGNPNNWDL